MKDRFGRTIDYARFSLTSRCNLRCPYCYREEIQPGPKDELKPDEIAEIVSVLAELNIHKVRLSGGEPLLRPDLEEIISAVSKTPGIRETVMTTNAQGLTQRLRAFKNAGLIRLNISLDSLQAERYRSMNGGSLEEVLSSMDMVIALDMLPLKINCVLLRGINDDEIEEFINMARERPLQIRFIELMPIGKLSRQDQRRDPVEILKTTGELKPVKAEYPGQPAQCWSGPGFKGSIGFIRAFSAPFCRNCNRIRISCEGRIRPCLADDTEWDIRSAIGNPARLKKIITTAIESKPEKHRFSEGFIPSKFMYCIGG
ncbi:MAG: GTP 3',8-cyclase MoaA [Treponema sp.]|jgi:cyclic pyranopterin phosphate synthase|nr:GTP 3',8-cyclase MoaA [Treponema sp.]